MSLCDIANKYETDKGSHGYCPHYERLISPKLRLLEMGIAGGGSLRMWREWLPGAEIIGFDSNLGDCQKARGIGFIAIHGNQSNVDDLATIPGVFNIIIDDAGHNNDEQKVAFSYLWPKLLSDGWYVIEDLSCKNIHDNPPDSVEALAKSQEDVKEVHHICEVGESAILFLKKK